MNQVWAVNHPTTKTPPLVFRLREPQPWIPRVCYKGYVEVLLDVFKGTNKKIVVASCLSSHRYRCVPVMRIFGNMPRSSKDDTNDSHRRSSSLDIGISRVQTVWSCFWLKHCSSSICRPMVDWNCHGPHFMVRNERMIMNGRKIIKTYSTTINFLEPQTGSLVCVFNPFRKKIVKLDHLPRDIGVKRCFQK